MNSIDVFLDKNDKWDSCTGCASCQNVCLCDAIMMKVDVINGYMPYIDKDICIGCGKCLEACPIMIEDKYDLPILGYATIAEEKIRKESSSGGAFSVMAEAVLKKQGVIYGVGWNDKLEAVHTRITCIKELDRVRYSKYVQSDTSNIFRKVKRDLSEKKLVLFVGTPCQAAGLKRYIDVEQIDDENLYIVDLICANAPSPELWRMYLMEEFGEDNLPLDYRFRDKIHGWRVISNYKKEENGEYIDIVEDYYLKAFLENLMFRSACETCAYRKAKPGDITIGDFWKVRKYESAINAEFGVSAILVNTPKGNDFIEDIKNDFLQIENVEVKRLMDGGGFRNLISRGTKYFRHQIRKGGVTLKKAYEAGRDKRYDIGLVGEWCNHNYGSHLTYFALKKTLEKMGKSVLLIGPPVTWWKHSKNIFGDERFRELPDLEDVAYLSLDEYDYEYLNEKCDMFCVGADTTFNEFQFFDKKKYAGLAWTDAQKGRIVYGGSFGTYDFNASKEKIDYLKYCFERFDKISFRERAGVELADKVFDVKSDYVLDPVFLLSAEEWRAYSKRPKDFEDKPFGIVFFYEDNGHDSETECFLQKLKEKYKCEFYFVTREASNKENSIPYVKIEELIWLIEHAEVVLTNSFHVTAMSIIFNRLFYAIHRVAQLPTRIPDILTTCELKDRMIIDYRYNEIDLQNEMVIDYEKVNNILQRYITNSKLWLTEAVKKAENKPKLGWNECDYLRRRVDELSRMVTKLTEKVNELSGDSKVHNYLEECKDVTKEEFIKKYSVVANMNNLMADSLERKGYKNIAVYGVGIIGKIIIDKLHELETVNVKYLIDKTVREYNGELVHDEPCDSDVDVILVTVLNEDEDIKRYIKSFYREVKVLLLNDWIDELNNEITTKE